MVRSVMVGAMGLLLSGWFGTSPVLARAEQSNTEQSNTEQGKTEQSKTEQGKADSGKQASGSKGAVVNLSTASAAELEALPGIGASMAAKIIEYREKNGFAKVEDLMNIRGIGEKSFLKLKPLITITPAKTEQSGGSGGR